MMNGEWNRAWPDKAKRILRRGPAARRHLAVALSVLLLPTTGFASAAPTAPDARATSVSAWALAGPSWADLKSMAARSSWLLGVSLGAVIIAGFEWWSVGQGRRNRARLPDSLMCAAHMPLSARSRVALLQVGLQHVLVGHDARGIRSMVLLPPSGGAASALPEASLGMTTPVESPYFAAHARIRFLDVEDSGWDLNHPVV